MFTYIIEPQPISHQTIRNEIANTLHIAVTRIKRFEHWEHRLWAHIEGIGGRIISYRSLPTYLQQAFLLIKNCQTFDQLWELGQLFKLETEHFSKYYQDDHAQEYLDKLREAWAQQRDDLREEEKRLAPIRKHRQDGQEWLESWQKVISRCQNFACLQQIHPVIECQSKEFDDLPEMLPQLLKAYEQRWEEIINSDF